jgi:LTXXQ motif family protein
VGLGRNLVGLCFLMAADLGLASAPLLAHGDMTMRSPPPGAARLGRDLTAPSGLLLAARDQGTRRRSHPPKRQPAAAWHAAARDKPRRPPPPRFHGGPNGVIDSPPLIRPGSPGREASARGRGGFIAWYGPAFWPYAYDDLFEYLLWPADDADYDGLFWVDAFTATVDPALGPASAASPPGPRPSVARSRAGVRGLAGQSREFAEICGRRTPGRTGWPAERVSRTLDPTGGQKSVLGAFKAATAAAATALDEACANGMPSSSVSRLEAIERRLEAMRQAVAIVRPALDGLYGALNDAQRARLDGPAPDPAAAINDANPTASTLSICGPPPPEPSRAPSGIELTPTQRAALTALTAALGAAVERLRAACPAAMPWTLPQRLSALETRLGAMLAAVRIERPALAAFCDALGRQPQSPANDIAPPPR